MNPTYRDRLSAIENEWSAYRRVLRRADQSTLDQLVLYACDHADTAGTLDQADPLAPV
ncbi:hypothetical protein SAMN06266787_10846 [Halorubrum ezzemoulense]|uniref:DUF8156 domain-containing protein n=1 Tax=Halorubrum ezzemoulense TaxID=337243 RepID=A0A238Y429_HALEZ|nr:hypothetical protein SAMN06266787_10846 [Halorubrum ezzemoulense]